MMIVFALGIIAPRQKPLNARKAPKLSTVDESAWSTKKNEAKTAAVIKIARWLKRLPSRPILADDTELVKPAVAMIIPDMVAT